MSLDAYRWAWQQRCDKSMDKFVLVSMADRADETHCCFPSVSRLTQDTQLDRKTVIGALDRLSRRGLIRDTGKRKGRTGKVKVYQLMGVEDRHAPSAVMSLNTPNNRTIESTQKRNDTENGTVPYFPVNGPKNGTVNSPKNGTQNLSVESINETISTKKAQPRKPQTAKHKGILLDNLPEGLSEAAAKNFIDHRATMKKPLTQYGFGLYIKALLKCEDCGLSLDEIVDETIEAGWQSVKPSWLKNRLSQTGQHPASVHPDDHRPRQELIG